MPIPDQLPTGVAGAELALITSPGLARPPAARPPMTLEAVVLRDRPARRWPRVLAGLVVITVAGAALAGLVWVGVLAVLSAIATVTAAIAWLKAHLWALIAAGLALLLLGGGGAACAGLHCAGCRGGGR